MIVKMIQDLRKRLEAPIKKIQEKFNKGLEELKNKQMNRVIIVLITEMKNTLEGINSRIIEAEEQISDLEDRMVEISSANRIKKKE